MMLLTMYFVIATWYYTRTQGFALLPTNKNALQLLWLFCEISFEHKAIEMSLDGIASVNEIKPVES